MTESTPLPPLPPPRLEDVQPSAPSRLPLAIAAAALVAVGVMALLWLGARSSERDAVIERDAATAERDAASDAGIDANAELQTVRDELAAAQAELDTGSATDTEADAEALQALEDRVAELDAEVERLEDENETLATDLEAARTTAAPPVATTATEPDATTAPTTSPSEPDTDADAEAEAVSPEDIGDQISGLFRGSVLGSLQKFCLGRAVIDDLGEARTIEAIAASSPEDDDEFVDAVSAAAEFCNIDQSAVFG